MGIRPKFYLVFLFTIIMLFAGVSRASAATSSELTLTGFDVQPVTAKVNESVTFAFDVANNGPDDAGAITANFTVNPTSNLVLDNVTSPACSVINSQTVTCDYANLAVGSEDVISITAHATFAGTQTLDGAIRSLDSDDPDFTNNIASLSYEATASQADLSLIGESVTPDLSNPKVGETVIMHFTVANNGPDNATNVNVSFSPLASSIAFDAAPSDGCSVAYDQLITCHFDTLTSSETHDIQIEMHATSPGVALVSGNVLSDVDDPAYDNNAAILSFTADDFAADLSLTSVSAPEFPVAVGSSQDVSFNLVNNGPDDATNVFVTFNTNSFVTDSVNDPHCTILDNQTTVTCIFPSLINDEIYGIVLTGHTDIDGSASVFGNVFADTPNDPDQSNNSSYVEFQSFVDAADINITNASVVPGFGKVGDQQTITFVIGNNGPRDAFDVNAVFTASQDLFITSVDNLSCFGNTDQHVTCNFSYLPSGSQETVIITAQASQPGEQNLVGTLTPGTPVDPNDTNNSATATYQATARQADLSLSPSVPEPVGVETGDSVNATFTVANNGPDDAHGVVVSFEASANLSIDSSSSAECDISTDHKNLTCNYPDLLSNTTDVTNNRYVDVVMHTTSAGTATLSGSISGDGTTQDTDASNDNTTYSFEAVDPSADIAFTSQFTSNLTPTVDENNEVDFTLQNNGPDDAQNVTASFTASPGLVIDSSSSPECIVSLEGTNVVCTYDTFANEDNKFVILSVHATESGPQAIDGSVNSGSPADPNTTNNSSSVALDVLAQEADLSLVGYEASPATAIVGDDVEFYYTLQNNGPNVAQNVTVVLTPDADSHLVFDQSNSGECSIAPDSQSLICTYANFSMEDVSDIIFHVHATEAGQQTINAVISSSQTDDPNMTNNDASLSFVATAPSADTSIDNLTVPESAVPSNSAQTIEFDITNNGPDTANNINANLEITGGTITSVDDNGCGVTNEQRVDCDYASLISGETHHITVSIQTGDAENVDVTAHITASDPDDPNLENNDANATFTVFDNTADLALTATPLADANVGDDVVITFTATNNGSQDAPSTVLVFTTSPDLVFTSVDNENCFVQDASTVRCLVGTIAANDIQNFVLHATANAPGEQNVHGAVQSQVDSPSDPNLENNTADATFTAVQVASADLGISHGVVSVDPANIGDSVVIPFTVTNSGPDTATNTVAVFTPSTNLIIDTSDNDACALADNILTCNFGDVSFGENGIATVDITVHTTASGTQELDGVVSSQTDDPEMENNATSASFEAVAPATNISVTNTSVTPQTAVYGTNTDVRFAVANNGENSAFDTTVEITPVSGSSLQILSSTTTSCIVVDATHLTCAIVSLAPEQSVEIQVTVRATTPGEQNVIATVSNETDTNANDNTATAMFTALAAAPENETPPVVTGQTTVGSTLACSTGTWTGTGPLTYTYQYLRNGTIISGATDVNYTLVAADVNTMISCAVQATGPGGMAQATSDPVGPISAAPVAPTLASVTATGDTTVGSTISCAVGTFTGDPMFSYTWLRDGLVITDAHGATYQKTASDVGHLVACRVTASNAAGSDTKTSNSIGPITAVVTPPVVTPPVVTPPTPTGACTVTGTVHKDYLVGTSGNDVICGLGGNDVIVGLGGNDKLLGGPGNDKLIGGTGNDKLLGGSGADVLTGDSGADTMYGEAGNDLIHGNAGNDYIDGGLGNDVVYGDAGNDKIYGNAGNDRLSGGSGRDYVNGGAGSDQMYGNADRDRLWGYAGNDVIYGGAGNDVIWGGAGNDRLFGDGGNDIFYRSPGCDNWFGGPGSDREIIILRLAGIGCSGVYGGV